MNCVIRALGPEDADVFRDLRLEALRLSPEAFGSTYEVESARPPEFFVQRLAGSTVFGGFVGDTLLGMAGFRQEEGLKDRHKAMLWGLYVRPAARGTGLSRELVDAVLDHARGRVEQVMLAVVADNAAAHRLYAAAGFVQYGLQPAALKQDGRYYDERLMVAMLREKPFSCTAGEGGERQRAG
jgi:RimJ/RimL family protein N-acetyltransferase